MIIYAICGVWLGAWGLWGAVQAWRTGWVNRTGKMPAWWPMGMAGWTAYSRMYPCAYAAVMCGVLGIFLSGGAQTAAATMLVIGAALAVVVTLFTWPRFLVPPARRQDTGLMKGDGR